MRQNRQKRRLYGFDIALKCSAQNLAVQKTQAEQHVANFTDATDGKLTLSSPFVPILLGNAPPRQSITQRRSRFTQLRILAGYLDDTQKNGQFVAALFCPDLPQKGDQMTKLLKAAIALSLGLTWTAGMASAQGASCANRDTIVERLASKYGETRQSAGLNQNNGMVEVFASEDTGTWTILVTMPTGVSCLMAAGKAWQGLADLENMPNGKGA